MKHPIAGMWAVVIFTALHPSLHANIQFITADLSDVRNQAAQEGKLYFVHFTATWCMPCQWMEEHTFVDQALSSYVQYNYLPVKFDVDESRGLVYKKQYNIKLLPSLLIFNAQGVLIDRYEESMEPQKMLQILEKNNTAGNRAGTFTASTSLVPDASILNSPKPNFVISRPALRPDTPGTSAAVASTVALKPTAPQAQPVSTAMKSEKGYGIQVGVFTDYSNAVQEVGRLERRFEQPVNIFTGNQDGRQMYKVVIGLFPLKSKAEDYLNYLQRNDVLGFIRDLAEL